MKTLVASIAIPTLSILAFTAPAFAGGMGCASMTTAKMSQKAVVIEQIAQANIDTLKLIDGKRLALV